MAKSTATYRPAETPTSRVRMLVTSTHKDGTLLEADKEYDLPLDSADMWVNRRQAIRISGGPVAGVDQPVAGPQGDGIIALTAEEVAAKEQALGLQGIQTNESGS